MEAFETRRAVLCLGAARVVFRAAAFRMAAFRIAVFQAAAYRTVAPRSAWW